MKPAKVNSDLLAGCFWMAVAVLIWASWLVLTSAGRTTGLSLLDLTVLRAFVPALLLLPVLIRGRHEIARLGMFRCLLLSAYGAPFTLCVGYGLSMAPVAHAAALVPGMMPLIAAGLGALVLGERIRARQASGYVMILFAAGIVILQTDPFVSATANLAGHVFFLTGASFWACFAVTVKTVNLSPYLATAIVGVVSSIFVVPFWLVSDYSSIAQATWPDILFQTFFQGIASGVLSLFAFTRALALIGARASMMAALTPGVAAVLAIPVLGQMPDGVEILALAAVVLGLIVSASRTR